MLHLTNDATPHYSLELSPRDLTVIVDALSFTSRHHDDLADDALALEIRLGDYADNAGVPAVD